MLTRGVSVVINFACKLALSAEMNGYDWCVWRILNEMSIAIGEFCRTSFP